METLKTNTTIVAILLFSLFSQPVLAHDESQDELAAHEAMLDETSYEEAYTEEAQDDYELLPDFYSLRACAKASSSQVSTVNSGNAKYAEFIDSCISQTGSSKWCEQIARPNPSSKSTFYCTYSESQPHRLVHPTTTTWKNAIGAIQLIQKLSAQGICVSQIYNWWRPEPYNKNVGGAAGRHPFGTSVDVRFCTNSDAIKGFDKLCEYRKQGLLRAIGYYGSTGVHFGVGDSAANTWGRACK